MKKLFVTVELEMEVPDSWELVQSEDYGAIIKMEDGKYLDMTYEPMISENLDDGWTNGYTDEFMNMVMEMVQVESTTMELDK